jgi:hypothetical protein
MGADLSQVTGGLGNAGNVAQPVGAGAASSASSAMAGGTIISAGMAVAGMVSGIFGYYAQKAMMNSQWRQAKAQFALQDFKAQSDKRMSIAQLESQERMTNDKVALQGKYLKAVEDEQKSKNEIAYVRAERAEWKRTQKATKANDGVINAAFRCAYSTGSPKYRS